MRNDALWVKRNDALTAMWPRPPMLTMPTRLVGVAYIASGLNTEPFGWSRVGTMEEGSVRMPGLSRGTGDATSGTTTWRPARASRLAQAPPTRERGVERPARVGRPAGGSLPCGAALRTQPARPDPPPALPVLPTAGGTGPAVRRGGAAQAARRRLGLALAGRQPGLGALKR